MEVAWQVIVDGNLDNTDMDYRRQVRRLHLLQLGKAVDLGGMMRNERDWVVVFDIPRIEAEIKAKRFVTLGDSKVPVVDGRRKDGKDSPVTRYIPVPKNPHGLNTSPDGKYFIANGKLSPTCTMIAIERLGDLFAGKLADPRDVVVGEPELGLGPLHTTFDGRGNAYTTLFIDSQLVKWNLADAVRAYKGEKVDYIRQKLDVQYQPGHNHATLCETSEADGKWIVVLSKFSKDRFLPTGPLHPENDQLIDISGEEMKLVHDGPTFAEPHDCILARRDQIKTRKIWDRKDPFFAETVKRAEKDGIDLMKDNKVIREGNKVRVYMVSMAPSFGLTGVQGEAGRRSHRDHHQPRRDRGRDPRLRRWSTTASAWRSARNRPRRSPSSPISPGCTGTTAAGSATPCTWKCAGGCWWKRLDPRSAVAGRAPGGAAPRPAPARPRHGPRGAGRRPAAAGRRRWPLEPGGGPLRRQLRHRPAAAPLRCEAGAELDGGGHGSLLTLTSPGITVEGCRLRNWGAT